jgi:hypothetical protein
MTRSRQLVLVASCVAMFVVAVGTSWLLGRQRALTSLEFVDVSATTAARAMQDDHFYSDFGDKVLVIHGTVASVQVTSVGPAIALRTDTEFGLTCTISGSEGGPQPSVGTAVNLVAIGGSAQRESTSVNLPDCRSAARP